MIILSQVRPTDRPTPLHQALTENLHQPTMSSAEDRAVATTTNNDHLVQSDDPEHPANLIPELCRKFYNWGWVTGTGGGVSLLFTQVRGSSGCQSR